MLYTQLLFFASLFDEAKIRLAAEQTARQRMYPLITIKSPLKLRWD